jgi:hypothetical protein
VIIIQLGLLLLLIYENTNNNEVGKR